MCNVRLYTGFTDWEIETNGVLNKSGEYWSMISSKYQGYLMSRSSVKMLGRIQGRTYINERNGIW